MVNETRLNAAKWVFFGPLVCAVIVGIFFGLRKVPWHLINWKFGVGTAACLWLILSGILFWSGSKEDKNETQDSYY